ncbi:heavy metal translocating P-type ATPase [Arhodomonas sp. AD133]|uniref:heavy metal translocating P-type ATPase n=1 Tax=Arhodomonas sp. AD133 TaxID=3415009 RepID=UPI003EBD19F2
MVETPMGEAARPGARESLQLKIGGMSCSFCANAIERGLSRDKGVDEVHVSLAHEEALIRYRPAETSVDRITHTLKALGYIVRDPRKVGAFDEQLELKRKERNDLLSAAGFAVVMFLAMAAMWLDWWLMRDWHVWAAWAIATYVFAWNGRRIARMAWGAAWRGITNQHVLLSVGAIGAYIGGVLGAPLPPLGWYGLVGFPAVDFFGVVVFLTAYHLLSGYVSLVVRTKASESVRRLLEMQPATARLVRDGEEREVPLEEIAVDDRVRVRPGDRIPVDGVVEDGVSAVDQSLVTGEPIPTEKRAGDEAIGGSVNQNGTLLIRVTRVGEDSFLQQVARHVEEAKALKPGIIVLVDRVLLYYVPTVLTVSGAALLVWSLAPLAWGAGPQWVTAIYAAVTVLVMGYPCALGMATPLALIRGGGMAAERGILMRSGEAFQVLKDITHVVLDKTGTITEGKPRLVAVEPLGAFSRDALLRLAGGAEAASEHPLAQAIAEAADEEGLEPPEPADFEALAGRGVRARVEGHQVIVGTSRYLGAEGIDVEAAAKRLAEHETHAHTAVLVAVDGALAGLLAIADTVKPDARKTIAELKVRGVTVVMLTGDSRRTADAVAGEVGIDEVHAEILPQDKAEVVRELQQRGALVAMVGDGINDAPALTQAQVGIAIGAGTDIAIESSDVVIIGERLAAVPEARAIGRLSYRKTVQNLWLAFFFNGVGVPTAATGILHPAWAMIAMALSVTLVLANSFGGWLLSRGPVTLGLGSGSEAPPATPTETAYGTRATVLVIPDMHCSGCAATLSAYLSSENGVERVVADARTKKVYVTYRPEAVDVARLETAVTAVGYRVTTYHEYPTTPGAAADGS